MFVEFAAICAPAGAALAPWAHLGGMGNMGGKSTMGGMNDMAGQTEREQCVDGHAKPQKVFSAH